MKRQNLLTYEFVEFIPNSLQDGIVYVSIPYTTVVHKCCCGCGKEVVTPLSPTGWRLIFDGETISLDPSIGNWNLPCRSHYWIRRNRVQWVPRWSERDIYAGRLWEAETRKRYYRENDTSTQQNPRSSVENAQEKAWEDRLWQRVLQRLFPKLSRISNEKKNRNKK